MDDLYQGQHTDDEKQECQERDRKWNHLQEWYEKWGFREIDKICKKHIYKSQIDLKTDIHISQIIL